MLKIWHYKIGREDFAVISNLWVKFCPLDWAATFRRNRGGYSGVCRYWASSFTNGLVLLATIKSTPEACQHSRDTMSNVSPAATYPEHLISFWFIVKFGQNFYFFKLLTHIIRHSNTVLIKHIRVRLIFIPSLQWHRSTIHPPLSKHSSD